MDSNDKDFRNNSDRHHEGYGPNGPEEHGEFGHHGPHFRHPSRFRWNKFSLLTKIGIILAGLVLASGGFIGFGFGLAALWNWLMPSIFNLPSIGFWQAWGLMLLCSILFKSTNSGKASGDYRRKRKLRNKMADYQGRLGDHPENPGEPV